MKKAQVGLACLTFGVLGACAVDPGAPVPAVDVDEAAAATTKGGVGGASSEGGALGQPFETSECPRDYRVQQAAATLFRGYLLKKTIVAADTENPFPPAWSRQAHAALAAFHASPAALVSQAFVPAVACQRRDVRGNLVPLYVSASYFKVNDCNVRAKLLALGAAAAQNPFLFIPGSVQQEAGCAVTGLIDPAAVSFGAPPNSNATAQATVPGAVDYYNPDEAVPAGSFPESMGPTAWWAGGGFSAGKPCARAFITAGYVAEPAGIVEKKLGANSFRCKY